MKPIVFLAVALSILRGVRARGRRSDHGQ